MGRGSDENTAVWSRGVWLKLENLDYTYSQLHTQVLFLALIWLVVCGIHWRDILQIQIWIGGMIALTMVEMSVFCSKYQVNLVSNKSIQSNYYIIRSLLIIF